MGKQLDEAGLQLYDENIKRYIGNATTKYSENLSGNIEQEAEFAFRPTAGSLDVAEQANSDQALIKGVKGRTVSWNQQTKPQYTRYNVNNIQITVEGTKCTVENVAYTGTGNDNIMVITPQEPKNVVGHKYLVLVESGIIQGEQLTKPMYEGVSSGGSMILLRGNLWYLVLTCNKLDNRFFLKFRGVKAIGDSWWFDKPMLFDLTLIYGEGKEPTTAEQFEADYEAWFGKPLTYEAYTAGELRNLNMVGVKTQGFNLLGSGTMPIKWNQLIVNGDFSDGTNGWRKYGGTISASNNQCIFTADSSIYSASRIRQNINFRAGHKMFLNVCLLATKANSGLIRISTDSEKDFLIEANTKTHASCIISNKNDATALNIYMNKSGVMQEGDTCIFSEIIAVDLTLLYGEGNEPTSAEQFEADYKSWFGKELTYEAYNEGTEMNVPVGKTLVMADTPYQISGDFTTIKDSQGTAITPDAQGLFTPEETTEVTVSGVGDDTCLHFVHSGRRNGEYEEHWEETKEIDVTRIKGKLDGTGSSTYVCPQGLLQAGDVRDEIYVQDGKWWFAKRVERRAYQSGDAQSSTMTTDGVNYTNYELATHEYYLLDDEWQDDAVWSYKVDDWGTEEVVSPFSPVVKQSAPFVGIIMYGVNALDTLRNLTKNFVATTSNQGLTRAQKERARSNIDALGMYDADYVANITYENNAIRQATWEDPDDGEPIFTDVVTVDELKADMGVDALTQRVANIEAIIGDSSGDEQLFRFDSEQLAIGYTLTGDEAALFLATLNSHQYWRFMVYTLYDNELQYETAMSAVQLITGHEGAILRGVGINGNVTMYAHFNSDGSILVNNSL